MHPPSLDVEHTFSTTLPLQIFYRPVAQAGADWQEVDRGPGVFKIPAGNEACLRLRLINDQIVAQLVNEINGNPAVRALNLSENRNITDRGLGHVAGLRQLTELNLSSCSLTDRGLASLPALTDLARLNLSYCNRLTDVGIKQLKELRHLVYLDLQGCVKITNGGISKIRRVGLDIHR